jgi:hypothetical protein
MARPGTPVPGNTVSQAAAALLAHFDPEARSELQRRLSDGSITADHIAQLYRLISSTPEERDAEAIGELLDVTAGMAPDEFRKWVDERIARWKDQ